MLPNRIIDASTLICGGVAVRDCPKIRTGKVVVLGPGHEVRDDEVVDRQRERQQERGEDPRDDQRERDLEEGARRVSRRGPSPRPRASSRSPRNRALTVERDVAHAEHDVRDHDRREPELELMVEQHEVRLEEQREQRRAEHDLRRGERQHQEEVHAAPAPEPVAHERDRDERAEDRGDERPRCSAISRLSDQRVDQRLVRERVQPVVERELLPHRVELALRAR